MIIMGLFDKIKKSIGMNNNKLPNKEEKTEKNKMPLSKTNLETNTQNFTYLDDLIHSNKSEICLDFDIIIDDEEVSRYFEGIIIDVENLIIDGKNHFIDAGKKSRIFNIKENCRITLKNIIFQNAYFRTDDYEGNGGAIYNVSDELMLENCYFKNNTVSAKGVHGAAIYSSNSIIMEKCNFENNFFDDGYGSVYIRLTDNDKQFAKLKNCNFKNNHAKRGYGTALSIYVDGLNKSVVVELYNCNFENNRLNKGYGGATYFDDGLISLVNCNFKNNCVNEGEGSAIYKCHLMNDQSSLKLENCLFENNIADTTGPNNYYRGYGTVYTKSFLTCSNCIFKDNIAIAASAICNFNNECRVSNSVFKDTHDKSNSLLLQLNEDANLSIENCELSVNSPNEELIRLVSGFSVIKNSKFYSNNIYGKGHAIYNIKGNLSIYKSKFFDNNKTIFNDNILKIEKGSQLENTIELGKNANSIMYLKERIEENVKGFAYLDSLIQGSSGLIELNEDIIFDQREQNFYEGGIELYQDNLTIDGNFHIIDANEFSRVFYITGKNITLKNIIFKNGMYFKNFLDDDNHGGGVIYTTHDSSLNIINCEFLGCTSRNSGSVITNKGKIKIIKDSKFINNESNNKGTIINCRNSFSLLNCYFKSNSAMYGGGISFIKGFGTMANCIFEDNSSKLKGGAIDIDDGEISVLKSTFKNNTSEQGFGGGAIYNEKASINISQSHFDSNRGFYGGAIFNSQGTIIINDSSFDYNLAKSTYSIGEGDAINNSHSLDKPGEIYIKNSNFNSSTSKIIFNKGILDIDSSKFKDIHIISNEIKNKDSGEVVNGTVKIHSESLRKIINGGKIEVIENDENNYIEDENYNSLSSDEFKTKFISIMKTNNLELAKILVNEWIKEYPDNYEVYYAYVIANIEGDKNDLEKHMNQAFALTPPNEYGSNLLVREAERVISYKKGQIPRVLYDILTEIK